MDLLPYLLVAASAYLIGSIPSGAIVARLYRNMDLTKVGSQRTGATNTVRALGLGAGLIVLAGDFGKGALAVWLARELVGAPAAMSLAGFLVVVGHSKSVFLRGRGGRGVLSGLGGLAIASTGLFVIACTTGCVVSAISRYVSVGSMSGAAAATLAGLLAFATGNLAPELLPYVIGAPAFIILAHSDNIKRLRQGSERRLGQREAQVT